MKTAVFMYEHLPVYSTPTLFAHPVSSLLLVVLLITE